jgi:tetratricopeptide (TPR) repeat protein
MGSGDWEGALKSCDDLLALDSKLHSSEAGTKFWILLQQLKRPHEAYTFAEEVIGTVLKDDYETLNMIAWMIVDPESEIGERNVDLAMKAALRADELTKHEDFYVIDTLARVCFAKGETQKAIEHQALALKLADEGAKDGMRATLEEYKQAAK